MSGPESAPSPASADVIDSILDAEERAKVLANVLETLQEAVLLIIKALFVLIVGYIIMKIILWIIRKVVAKKKFDPAVENFIMSTIGTLFKVILFTTVFGVLKIELLSLAAIIAALGLALGFTLGGLMSNFIAGLLLLTRKPFVKGDFIEAQGHMGTVTQIDVFLTTLASPDNKVVTIPNMPLASDTVINYSRTDNRRVDLVVGVAYDADLPATKRLLEKMCSKNEFTLKEPKATVGVLELGDNSVNFVVRPYVKPADYWSCYFSMQKAIKEALDEHGIGIPFPQRDVHLYEGVVGEARSDPLEFSESESDEEVQEAEVTKKSSKLLDVSKKGAKALKGVGKGVGKGLKSVTKVGKKSKKEKK
eukprot:TRINITY_DN663_c0_g1_i1.p1 TRINITY_DN663_c0_g1~~TRINITY_DN663_c0_g1_i1.p1  ORF type:complete len:385 (-),score=195.55 TRINITY_DN663_c0_g1_i1:92-1180(-)